jgi:anthranilate 1,2-dioxygenase large subunit
MTLSNSIGAEERVWPELGACRVPGWVYTDPELFDREMEKFHYGKTWSFVGLECELPEPNSSRRSFVGPRSVIITRDNDGQVHAMENRCAHRGAPVCWKQSGKSKDLTCPYHEWTYDLAGN